MVLQRQKSVPVWGTAGSSSVTVTFNGQVIDANVTGGNWRVDLDPMPAGGPYTMTIEGDSTVTYTNVRVGDAWLCSGQSNMDWRLSKTDNGPAAQATASDYDIYLYNKSGSWTVSNHETSGNFSAVGYYFGREMSIDQNIPIGLIEKAHGGSSVTEWQIGAEKYTRYIDPIVPYAIRGALWYQGERDTKYLFEAVAYPGLFLGMIKDWRAVWGQGDFGFFTVQLPPFKSNNPDVPRDPEWMMNRESHLMSLTLPKTGLAVPIDIYQVQIHPKLKMPIGQRLALCARAVEFGQAIEYMGPIYDAANSYIQDSNFIVAFTHTTGGLVSQDGQPLKEFEIAGDDGVFYPAEAVIDGNTLIVSNHTDVPEPRYVNYAWKINPRVNFFNGVGLPASPFRIKSLINQQEYAELADCWNQSATGPCEDYDFDNNGIINGIDLDKLTDNWLLQIEAFPLIN